MAESTDITQPRTGTTPAATSPPVPPELRYTPLRGNGRPDSPAEMRREIERTRARMSDTLDALEVRLERQRAEIERKKTSLVDAVTLRKARTTLAREPWRTMLVAFAAGYIVAAIRD